MSNDYVEMMRDKDRKQKETAELKQKWKEERDLRRIEKEKECKRMKEREEKKRQRGSGREKGEKRQRRSFLRLISRLLQSVRTRTRITVMYPAVVVLFELHNDIVTNVMKAMIATQCASSVMLGSHQLQRAWCFGVDCDACGEWAYMHCALGSNAGSRNFVCSSCSKCFFSLL